MKGKARFWLLGALGLAALVAGVFLMAGCGHDALNPVAPGDSGGGNPDKGLGGQQDAPGNISDLFNAIHESDGSVGGPQLGSGSWTLQSVSDTANVGKAGGTVTLNLGNQTSTLKIPADAVCSAGGNCSVRITATETAVNTPYGPLYLYDFGPDGLQFAKPCELKLFAGLTPGVTVSLYWLNPVTNLWQVIQSGKVGSHGEVKFTILHFSKYGIG